MSETITEKAVRLHAKSDQCSDEHDVLAWAVWHGLSGAAKDTLVALIKRGPLEDGDVPSKNGRGELFKWRLADRAIIKGEQGYSAANYQGWCVWRASGSP